MAKKDKTKTKLITLAHKRFNQSVDAESKGRKERVDDVKFVRLGEQWPENVKRDREQPGAERPMLTINRLFQFRNQVINEIRQNRPSIRCRPVDDDADIDTAEVMQGLIRHIQEASRADIAYDIATEWQVDAGLGYVRVITDYCDPESFDQDIVIKSVPDPMKVYYDPESVEPDGSDARFAFIVEEWSREEFDATYPDVDTTGWNEQGTGDSVGWYGTESVRIAEYFYLDTKPRTLAQLQDGSVAWKDEVPEEYQHLIINERKSESRKCKWCKLAGDQVIEETELESSFITIVPFYGSEVWIEGKRHLHGLTRHAKDPARLYNFFQSANAETLALAPKSPYIAAEGQLDNYETQWQNANRVNLSVLTYNPVSLLGNIIGPPKREPPPGQNMGFEAAMNRAELDIKATMGMFDAAMGNHENDQSGKAILSQQRQSNTGNFHFSDNGQRSIRQLGRIIIEMIPKIYDTQRVARILGEDGTPKNVQIDPNAEQAKTEQEDENGEIQTIYNLGVGKYDVIADVGPNFATKREEAAAAMMDFMKVDPAVLQIAGDIIVKNMDWPGAEEIAKRMKIMLPPQIQQAEKEGDQPSQIPPEIEQQMTQMSQMVEHLSQELQAATAGDKWKEEELEIKRFAEQTKRLEAEHKIALESTGLFHEMAMAQVQQTLTEPNDGEVDDNEETEEPPTQQEEQQ